MIKKMRMLLLTLAILVISAVPAFAVGVADTAVVGAFTTQSDNIVATLGAVAPFGIAILAIFLAWHYGKKLFKKVSA